MSATRFRLSSIAVLLACISVFAGQSTPPDRFFDSDGVRIRYVERGTGSAVVLMHGYTGTLDRHFLSNGVFADLAKDHRVIAFDHRGHGKSGKPHDPLAYGRAMAGDVVRLLDHLGIQRAHIVGYSLGALVAGRLATEYAERLASAVYVAQLPMRSTTTFFENFASESVKELEGDLPFRSLMLALQPAGTKPPSDDDIRAAVAPLVAVNDVKALAALWRGYDTLVAPDAALRAVKTPMLVLIGSEDAAAAGVPELNRVHPQIRTIVVEGAQHGGERGIMRRPEFLLHLRSFINALQ